MKKLPTSSKQGFTIIEVVLVLAIAGLIFLMVFIALPTLRTSQRDTQRRNDINRVAAQLTQYQTNNGGNLPPAGYDLKTNYLGGNDFVDPDGSPYTVSVVTCGKTCSFANPTSLDHKVYVYTNAVCNNDTPTTSGAGSRDYAVLYKLEGAGKICVDNK